MSQIAFPVTDHSGARRLATAWIALAAGSLGASAMFALLLVLSRTPGLGAVFPGHGFFQPALVLHVNLSALIWFLSFAGGLWSAGFAPRAMVVGWVGLWLAAAGAAVVVVSPFAGSPSAALANNYIPVLGHPVFLTGLALFGAGVLLSVVRVLWAARTGGSIEARPLRVGMACAALVVLFAVVSLAWSAAGLPAYLPPAARFEALFWGPGHVMQFGHTQLMMVAWLSLAAAQTGGAHVGARAATALFVLAAAPVAAVPLIHALYAPAGPEFREAFTHLMSWGTWIAAAPLGLVLLYRVLKAPPGGEPARGWRLPLVLSLVLFGFGLVVGSLVRGDNAMVPAHYHAVIGGITLAFMALSLQLLPALGFGRVAPRSIIMQAALYGGGTLLMAAGLAWSGGHGVARKTPGTEQLLDGVGEVAGMVVMGMGGLVAVTGSLLFVALVFRSMLGAGALARAGSGARVDRRPLALSLTAGMILVVGSFVVLLPGSGAGRSVMVQSAPADPQRDPQRHAQQRRRAEIATRFEQAVLMLHAKQYDHAATALHRVLELDPTIPEAHVNMGYAMLGLKRYAVARDFFEGATELRPMQANAYYGLAEALEALGDLPGATGAMRTYLHLARPDDPFRAKAEAALWEWEDGGHPKTAAGPGR